MDILQKTVQGLSNREAINYKQYANFDKSNAHRKDVLLFDLLKKEPINDVIDDFLFKKIYPANTNKNTFHRLKSRLQTEVDASVLLFHFHKTDSQYIYNEIGLYKIYIQKNELEIALYHLKKAEKKAIEVYDYLMLDVIYTEFINLSTNYHKIIPSIYIKKRKENIINLQDLRAIDEAIANILYDIKQSQNFTKAEKDKIIALDNAIKNINSKKQLKRNIVAQSKLYSAVSNLLLTKKDYATLEHYSIKVFKEFNAKKLFSKYNHQVKIQMLMYICNTLFINEKHNNALIYIDILKKTLHEFKDLMYDNYVFFYYNSLANNYSAIQPEKTIPILNEAKNAKAIKNNPTHLGYVYLNLIGAYFDAKKYKTALKTSVDLYKHNIIEKLSDSIKLNFFMTDIILRIELGQYDYVKGLITTLLKEYKFLLKQLEYKKDYNLLLLFKKVIKNDSIEISKHSQSLISKFYNTYHDQSSNTVLKYNKWLLQKFKLMTT